MRESTYEIHLRGELPPDLIAELAGSTCRDVDGETLLLTLDIDQASLHDLVTRLADLGIELLELRRANVAGPAGAPADRARKATGR